MNLSQIAKKQLKKLNSLQNIKIQENRPIVTESDIDQILRDHQIWIDSLVELDKKISGRRASFKGADLRNFNFSGLDLRAADFSDCALDQANFSNCDLSFADFSRANLSRCSFLNARRHETQFEGSSLAKTP